MLTSLSPITSTLSATLPVPDGATFPTPKPRPTGFPPQALVRWA